MKKEVKEHCKKEKIKLRDFAKKVGVSSTAYIFNAGVKLSFKTVYIIFDLLGLTHLSLKEVNKIIKRK